MFICGFSPLSFATQLQVDSVLNSLGKAHDTIKIKHLNELCWHYRSTNPPFSLECGQKALEISDKIGNKSLKARSLNLVGIICRVLGYYDKSIAYLRMALALAEETQNKVEMGFAENNIGGAYRLKGYYTAAMEHVLRGRKAFESINYKYGIAYSQISIGFIYEDQQNYPKALEYMQYAFNLRKEVADSEGCILTLMEIARAYAYNNNFAKAMETFKQVEEFFKHSPKNSEIVRNTNALADVFLKQKKYNAALPLQLANYNTARELHTVRGQALAAINLGIIYTNLKDFSRAEKYLNEGLSLANDMPEYSVLLSAYNAMSAYYEASNQYAKALIYARKSAELKDSILSKENLSGVKEMEAVYENEKNQIENSLLHKDLELSHAQRNYWAIITVLFIGISILIYWRYRYRMHAEEHIRKMNEELQALNATRDKFFSIIAHDLRSPFHVMLGISELLATESEELPPEQQRKFSRELHHGIKKQFELLSDLLEWSKLQRGDFPLDLRSLQLADIVTDVIDSLTVPFQVKNLNVQNDISPDTIIWADENMIRLVIRNLLSNGIKFTPAGGKITISSANTTRGITISVSDTGIGISEEDLQKLFHPDHRFSNTGTANEKGTGLGLLLCKEILDKHNGTISIKSTEHQGSTFTVSLPPGPQI
ncbi:MAG: ATP-binding protein [Ignavibacteria bacterium]|nr:ATP-binding protein [Ignavibacteria bacterium]